MMQSQIIGGADGPTTIFLAGKLGEGNCLTLFATLAIGIIAAVLIIALILSKKS